MNYAKLSESPRLQYALAVLEANPGLGSMEWQIQGRITSASAADAELSRNGILFERWWDKSANGKKVYRRRVIRPEPTMPVSTQGDAIDLARKMVAMRAKPWTKERVAEWGRYFRQFCALVPDRRIQDEMYLIADAEWRKQRGTKNVMDAY